MCLVIGKHICALCSRNGVWSVETWSRSRDPLLRVSVSKVSGLILLSSLLSPDFDNANDMSENIFRNLTCSLSIISAGKEKRKEAGKCGNFEKITAGK